MNLLPLDDPRWLDLEHRNWSQGQRSPWAPEAPFVPDELSKLCDEPDDLHRFNDLWPWLCSEGTAWEAAYAVVPYAAEFARRLPPERRFDYLLFIGLVEISSCTEQGEIPEIPPYLVEGYQAAKVRALRLLAETITCHHGAVETRELLATIAALKGHSSLGETLNHLDCVSGRCPRCGEEVYPGELQHLD
jgi:hypothetical protein